jgi:hypothetical protein
LTDQFREGFWTPATRQYLIRHVVPSYYLSKSRVYLNRHLEWSGDPASDSRRTSQLLWLLPSGPDQIHNLSSRETNRVTIEAAHYARRTSARQN